MIVGCKNTVIPSSVTSIESGAFRGCSGLTSITIPSSVERIEGGAFEYCSGLESITVEDGNTYYHSKVGEDNCNAIIITSTNTLIAGCKNTVIPSSVTSIESGAFRGCSGLTTITIPNSVTSIGDRVFQDCSSLTSITIPSSVTSIGYNAFSGCSGLTTITIPNSVTSIGESAFQGCSTLTSITIPSSVTSIGYNAFCDCTGLTSVTCWRETPPTLGSSVFASCPSLTRIYVPAASVDNYKAAKNWSNYASIIEAILELSEDDTFTGEYAGITIRYRITKNDETGQEVEVIALESGKYTGEIIIPSTVANSIGTFDVTAIGDDTFYNCSELTSVTCLRETPLLLGNSVFDGCSSFAHIYVHAECVDDYKNATNWSDYASIIEAIIGLSVGDAFTEKNIRYRVIKNDETGQEVEVIASGSKYSGRIIIPSTVIHSAVTYNVTSIGYQAFNYCRDLTSITIPSSVTNIDRTAFRSCYYLASIIVEDGNTYYYSRDGENNYNAIIESSSNTLITGCKNTVIPSSLTSIGDYAFYDCIYLMTITIPSCLTSIGNYAFYGCGGLSTVVFKENSQLTSIGWDAFNDCTGLPSITIPGSVTSIRSSAFVRCSGLSSINIPSSVTSIERNAFESCSGLTSITIPNSVTSIGSQAFAGCASLSSINIPSSVTNIEMLAFEHCSALTSVTCWQEAPPTLEGPSVFYECPSLAHIYVFADKVDDYKSTTGWSSYSTIIEPITIANNAANGAYWSTFYYSGSDALADENTTVYTVTVSNSKAMLNEVADRRIKAGEAVVLKSATGNTTLSSTTEVDDTYYSSNDLKGVDAPTAKSLYTDAGKTVYTLAGPDGNLGFYRYKGTTLAANKAFLTFDSGSGNLVGFFPFAEDDATSVESPAIRENRTVAPVYDLMGRRVAQPTKGLYIMNGKKVLVK